MPKSLGFSQDRRKNLPDRPANLDSQANKEGSSVSEEGQQVTTIESAWHSVSLEERLELISRAQASGIMASVVALLITAAIAYGIDQIYLLAGGVAISVFVFPLYSSYTWRRGKPALILSYLAVRAVGRRYAYAQGVKDLEIILIHKGVMHEIFENEEEAELAQSVRGDESVSDITAPRNVWIMLMRGAVVILSERYGGAKLEFLSPIDPETVVEDARDEDDEHTNSDLRYAVNITGTGPARGRRILLSSKYRGSQLVFNRSAQALVEEAKKWLESQSRLRQKAA